MAIPVLLVRDSSFQKYFSSPEVSVHAQCSLSQVDCSCSSLSRNGSKAVVTEVTSLQSLSPRMPAPAATAGALNVDVDVLSLVLLLAALLRIKHTDGNPDIAVSLSSCGLSARPGRLGSPAPG